eukprot:403335865
MLSKDETPQYYSPQKRKEFKEHLASSSIKFNQQEMPHQIMKRQPIKQSNSHVDVFYFVGGNMSQPKQQVSSNKNLNQMKFVVNRDSLLLYNQTPSQDSFIHRVQNRHAQVLSSTCFQMQILKSNQLFQIKGNQVFQNKLKNLNSKPKHYKKYQSPQILK